MFAVLLPLLCSYDQDSSFQMYGLRAGLAGFLSEGQQIIAIRENRHIVLIVV